MIGVAGTFANPSCIYSDLEHQKTQQVMDLTGVNYSTASAYLKAEDWNISDAVFSIRQDQRKGS